MGGCAFLRDNMGRGLVCYCLVGAGSWKWGQKLSAKVGTRAECGGTIGSEMVLKIMGLRAG